MKKGQKRQKKRTAYIVSHTHWDREWRYPIWQTHLLLCEFMDELVEVLESGKYPGFLLDGQVVPVTDYLQNRPEMTERIKALVSAGKLQIGPWLLLPDEYPIDAESMVRNLLWGHRRAKELGGVFNVGYTAFGWGQTAQLPQIYAGFGVDVAMIGKKVGKDRAPNCEFIWRGPDGSELLTSRFGEVGRQNFYFKVHLSALFGIDHEGPQWRYEWAKGGIAYHRADREQMEQDHERLDAPDHWYPETITPEMLKAAWETTDESVLENDRLMMNGCDYTAGQPMFTEMLERIKQVDPDPDRQWVHTTMPDFVQMMKRKIDRSKLAVVKGELRDGPVEAMTGNALATRLYLKRLNKQAQNMLIRFAEPLSVVAAMAGAAFPQHLINKAWEFLLYAHPHDSVNGVTQDKTALDVSYRLNQVIDISQSLGNQAMKELIKRIDMSDFADEDILIAVFNPLPYPRRDVVEAWINVPDKSLTYPNWHSYPDEIQIFDTQDKAVATQWEGQSVQTYCVAEIHARTFPFKCQRHRLFFETGEVPACGYKIFKVGSKKQRRRESADWAGLHERTNTLLRSPNMLENEFLRVEMNPNGTFDLTDKRLGRTFKNLNYYQDRGEHGSYWVNQRPMFDQAHCSLGCNARIWSKESGPLQATLVSEVTMLLPQHGDKEQQCRGDKLTEFTIKTAVTLKAEAEQIEVNVEFENRHEDHYLRAMFPTNLEEATHADAGGHFYVDHRPIRPQGPSSNSIWPDMATLPQNNFVDVSDGKVGLAFLNDSLTEYEVLDNKERTVALSVLRAVRNWICTESRVGTALPSQKGGQSLGHHSIRYAIRPHSGDWKTANVPLAAEQFNIAPRPVQTRRHEGNLPAQQSSLFAIENSMLRFSTLKKTEDRNTFIVRIYNPTNERQKGRLRFAFSPARVWQTDLNEKRRKELKITKANTVPVTAEPYKILTVEIKMK